MMAHADQPVTFHARPWRTVARWLGVLATGLGLAGCSSTPSPATPAMLVEGAAVLTADEVFPIVAQVKEYRPADGPGLWMTRSLTPIEESPPGLGVRMLEHAGGQAPTSNAAERSLLLRRAPDGSVLLVWAREGDQTTEFDPPLVYMPAQLAPGQDFEATTKVRAVDARGRERSRGTATRRLRLAGVAPMDWAGASGGEARIVEGSLQLDMAPASVLTTTTFWIGPAGIERERQRTVVRVFGVPVENRRHDLVLSRDQGAAP